MPVSTRFRASMAQLACMVVLSAVVPAIAAVVMAPPAEARAGGHYGSTTYGTPTPSYTDDWDEREYRRRHRSKPKSDPNWHLEMGIFLPFMGGVVLLLGGLWVYSNRPGRPQPETIIERVQRKRVEAVMDEAAALDDAWDKDRFLAHAQQAYVLVQKAWVARNQDIAKDVMTPALYAKHKADTDAMRERGEAAALEKLEILAARPMYMADRGDDTRDEIWVQFTARAIDYKVDVRSGKVLEGSKNKLSTFKEVWKFKRDRTTWRVDAIEGDLHPMMMPKLVGA